MRVFYGLIWASPLRDVTGFMRRYLMLSAAIAAAGVTAAIVGDQLDRYFLQRLWRPVLVDGAYFYGNVCNFDFAARFIFFVFAFMELGTIVGLLIAAFRPRSEKVQRAAPAARAAVSVRTVSTFIAMVPALGFVHLSLYAVAFHYGECTPRVVLRQLPAYWALVAASVLYGIGAVMVIGFCLIGLGRRLMRAKSV